MQLLYHCHFFYRRTLTGRILRVIIMKRTFLGFFLLGIIILSFCFHEAAAKDKNNDDEVNQNDDIVSTKSPNPTREPTTPRPTSLPTSPPHTRKPTRRPTSLPTPPPHTRKPTAQPTPSPSRRPTTAKPSRNPTTMSPTRPLDPTPSPSSARLPTTINPTRQPTPQQMPPLPTLSPTDTSPDSGQTKPSTPSPSQEPTVLLPFTALPYLVDVDVGADASEETTQPSPSSAGMEDEESPSAATAPEDEDGSQTVLLDVDVVGTVRFSIVVRNGNRDNIPFSAYEPELTLAVTGLAHQVAKDMEDSFSLGGGGDGRHHRRHLQEQHQMLQVLDLPGSIITQVRTLGFTSNPDVSDLNVFLGGACPITSGDVQTDRCEEISASMGVLFAIEIREDGGSYESVDILEQVQAAFQSGLNERVDRGQLQFYMEEAFPLSRVSVISGQVVEREGGQLYSTNSLEAGDIGMGGDPAASVPVSAIVGIALALWLALVLAIVVWLVTRTRRRQRIEKSSIADNASMEKRPPILPATTYDVESHNDDDGYIHDDWSKLSFDDENSRAGEEPRAYGVLLNDDIIMGASEDEEQDNDHDNHMESSSAASASLYSMASDTQYYSSSTTGATICASTIMSEDRLIDLGELDDGKKNLREYITGIADFDELWN